MTKKTIEQRMIERRDKCVCKMCGGALELRLIVHNQYGGQGLDLYCPTCDKVEYGVEPEIYKIAKAFVDTFEFNYYMEMEENERNYRLNISKICEITNWILKYKGVVNCDGFLNNENENIANY